MDHREQNSSCPVTWDDEPRGFLTEWEATPMKPTEDAKMQKEWPESVWLDAFEVAAIRSQGWDKPPTQHVAKQVANSKREYVSAARIAELETKLQAVLRREEDANKAAFAHMRRITALEADGIAARKATAKNYARAEAAEVTADDLRAENERLRDAAGDLTKAMRLFWEADEAADEAKREGMACDAARYEKMATGRWQRIPCLIDALEAALQRKQEDV